MPERAIDTVLVRNLDLMCTAVLGSPGVFLFNNSEYWQGFDCGCVLKDGRLVCFENKKQRVTINDFRKFVNDVRELRSDVGLLYVAHRWQHHKDYLPRYQRKELRTFASFFLKCRCETESSDRDLPAEAASLLGMSQQQFQQQHELSAGWLQHVDGFKKDKKKNGNVGLYEYLREEGLRIDSTAFLPVLLAPDTGLEQIARWQSASPERVGVEALLVNYSFYLQDRSWPTLLRIEPAGTFQI